MTEPAPRGAIERLAIALATVAVAVVVVGGALTMRGREAMRASDEALARGDHQAAILFAERAAQGRFPGSPYPARAYDRLFAIADDCAAANDDDGQVRALRAVIVGAQTTGDPHSLYADDARRRLDALRQRPKPGAIPDAPRAADTSAPVAAAPPRVGLAISAVAALGALVWLMLRGGRAGWLVLVGGVVGVVLFALQ